MIEQETHQKRVTLRQEARSRVFKLVEPLYRDFNGLGLLIPYTANLAACIDVTRLTARDALDALYMGMGVHVQDARIIGQVAVGFHGRKPDVDRADSIALQL